MYELTMREMDSHLDDFVTVGLTITAVIKAGDQLTFKSQLMLSSNGCSYCDDWTGKRLHDVDHHGLICCCCILSFRDRGREGGDKERRKVFTSPANEKVLHKESSLDL